TNPAFPSHVRGAAGPSYQINGGAKNGWSLGNVSSPGLSVLRSGCCKPRYCGLTDIESACYVGLCFALRKSLDRFLPLVRCESTRAPEFHATGLSALPAFACSGTNQLALKFGQATENCQHQPAVRRGGIRPSVFQAAETSFTLANRGQNVQ